MKPILAMFAGPVARADFSRYSGFMQQAILAALLSLALLALGGLLLRPAR
jgi:hypothetical protein